MTPAIAPVEKKLSESLEVPPDATPTPPPPRKMGIELNNTCNHQCYFCAYTVMDRKRKRGNMDQDMVLRVLREAHEIGIREVGFYATGEPYLNPHLCDYIRYAREIGMDYVYISTNGAAATIEKMKESIEAGLDSLKFSINGGTRESYKAIHGRDDFEKVIGRVKELGRWRSETGRKFRLFVTSILSPENPGGDELLRALLGELVDGVAGVAMTSIGTQVSDALYRQIDYGADDNRKRFSTPCALLFTMLNVQKEGYVSACCSDFNNDLLVADLSRSHLGAAWHSPEFQDLRKRHLEHRIDGTLCESCILQKIVPFQPLALP